MILYQIQKNLYIYEYNKNKKLRYLRSKRANFSQVSDILFDNNTLYTLTKNGDLTILSYSENAAGEKKMKTPVSINFGEKIFGNVIESFTYQGIQYFVTAESEGKVYHPTQKPIKLYKWLLHNYTNENDLILDTHLGSGSIAIACHQMKRKLIGYEIDVDYYRKACKRFEDQTRQTALW